LNLSVLDLAPVAAGSTATEALNTSLELARLADRCGYTRLWFAEHHDSTAFASSAPEILVAYVAALTKRIRLGTGGVMLTHYSPLKVAESFRTLVSLCPDRIDLGLGKAPGGDPPATLALRPDGPSSGSPREDFESKVHEVVRFLRHEIEGGGASDVGAVPSTPRSPEVWVLGTSIRSAMFAARSSLPYAFAHFLAPDGVSDTVGAYRKLFVPSIRCERAKTLLAVSAVCSDSAAEAAEHASTTRAVFHQMRTSNRFYVPDAIEAATQLSNCPGAGAASCFHGTPQHVVDDLKRLAEQNEVEEIMVSTIVHDQRARLRSYELLAHTLDLARRPVL